MARSLAQLIDSSSATSEPSRRHDAANAGLPSAERRPIACPAENKMTKHQVPGSRTRGEPVTRDSSRYRYVGENKTLRENRAGARARRPGTIESLASRGARSRPGCLRLSRLTDKTLNRKHYCGAKKGHRQRFPTMVTKTHASEGQGVGRAGPVRCARFWSWQMTRDQEFKPLLSRCTVSAVWGLRM